jgi:hypothetical protein
VREVIFASVLAAALTHGSPVNADDLALGLDKLHWGMNAREARRRFPALDGNEPEPGQPDAQLARSGYSVAGCRFTLTLDFERAALAEIELESEGSRQLQACDKRIKALLVRQYGGEDGGFSPARNPHGFSEYASWSGAQTEVVYGALKNGFIDITFRRRETGR